MSALVVLAHGTASDAGTATVERLVADAGRRVPAWRHDPVIWGP